jgi:hypothetical protein
MVLGDSFPVAAREAAVDQRLVPGAVLYLEVTFPEDGRVKDKYLVMVASVDPDVLVFVVNTEVNQFVAARPELNRCQLTIDQAGHTFLDYDSFLACHKTLAIPRAQVAGDLLRDMSRYKGQITDDLRQQILGVIQTQPKMISKAHRDAITAALAKE